MKKNHQEPDFDDYTKEELRAFVKLMDKVCRKALKKPLRKIDEKKPKNVGVIESSIRKDVGLTFSIPTAIKYIRNAKKKDLTGVQRASLDTLARYILDAEKVNSKSGRLQGDYRYWVTYVAIINRKRRRSFYFFLLTGILALLLVFLIPYCAKRIKSTFKTPEEIIVGVAINDSDYLSYIKEKFEEKNSYRYRVKFTPDHNEERLLGPSRDRFSDFLANDEIDLVFGGNVAFYNANAHHFVNWETLLPEIRDYTEFFDNINHKWIAFYQKRLGCIWNTEELGDTIASLQDLHKYQGEILLPTMGISASHDLLIALSISDGEFNFEKGKEHYLDLLTENFWFQKPSRELDIDYTDLVAQSEPNIAIGWPHDFLDKMERKTYECLGVAIFDESVSTVSCMGLKQKNYGYVKEGAVEFIKFILSRSTQEKHFELSNRLPVHKDLYKQSLDTYLQKGVHASAQMNSFIFIDYDLENSIMNNLIESRVSAKNFQLPLQTLINIQNFYGCR